MLRQTVLAIVLPFALITTLAVADEINPNKGDPKKADSENSPAIAPGAHLSKDPQVAAARKMFDAADYDGALALLKPLVDAYRKERKFHRLDDNETDIFFLFGMAAMEKGIGFSEADAPESREKWLFEASAAFHHILTFRPSLIRVRLELARSLFLRRNDKLAREHFETVLAQKPHPNIAHNIIRVLSMISARRALTGYFGINVAPSRNINNKSGTDKIYIHGLPFRLNARDRPKSGTGIGFRTGGEYRTEEGFRFGGGINHTEYSGKEFDSTQIYAHLGPRLTSNVQGEVGLLLTMRQRFTANSPTGHDVGIRLETIRNLTRKTKLEWSLERFRRNYRERKSVYAGPGLDINASIRHLLRPGLQLNFGISRARVRPKTRFWRSKRLSVWAGASKVLQSGFTIGGSLAVGRTRYYGNWFPYTDGVTRRDRSRHLQLSVLNGRWLLWDFSPKLTLRWTRNKSNGQTFSYKTTSVQLEMLKQF